MVNDGNIVMVTKLREEINSLKKQLTRKDAELIEKDKQVLLVHNHHYCPIYNAIDWLRN